ncbi:MAG: hypothetical protein RLN88_15455 [Ekhidna sp.]|uniref:class I SAM-dependent methyltransferase n=1 Tax=Ekhidna sp. TaxID=2608089 RepID=UPI0032EEC2D5
MDDRLDFLSQDAVKAFIKENQNADPSQLILNPPSGFKEHIKEISSQILARQKAKGKLDSWSGNFDLIMPPPLSIEQASSEATCAYKQQLVSGKTLIDLTGGMGVDCLALSQSFNHTIYVEQQKNLCDLFAQNSNVLGREIDIVHNSAEAFLNDYHGELEETFIYLDPARRDDHKNKVFRIEDCSPDVAELLPKLAEKASKVLIKFSPILDITSIVEAISQTSEVHIVSVKNDCKEILVYIDFSVVKNPSIRCVNLESNQPDYRFDFESEKKQVSSYSNPKTYIYEPNSSVMKAGAFKKVGVEFGLEKLEENTHLYTSDDAISSFPGRTFRVVSADVKKEISKYAPGGKINVITRNYPLSAPELKKKWKLKDGGDYFLIAFRNLHSKPQMVIAERVGHSK